MPDQEHSEKTGGNVTAVARLWKKVTPGWIAVCVALLVTGAIAGYLVAGSRSGPATGEASADSDGATLWTCSMHPQVRLPEPGLCPICDMELKPLDNNPAGPRELKMSQAAIALAHIEVQPVVRKYVARPVRMVGRVDQDETRIVDIAAWIPGRLERLFVDYTGVAVRKGDHLFVIYSSELIQAQRELLLTWESLQRHEGTRNSQMAQIAYQSSEKKLLNLGLLPEQIEQIKRKGTPTDQFTIYSPVGGIVTQRYVNRGAVVQQDTKIYSIIDLSHVWVHMDAYESDLPWLRYGQKVEFTTESFPGKMFLGTVTFIDPVLNEKTRTTRVRVNVVNDDMRLKPGMFIRAVVQSELGEGGRVLGPVLAGKWICPMHPEVIEDGPGQCDICSMDLEPGEQLGLVDRDGSIGAPLVIPATAPLVTGKRAVVYVRVPTSADLFRDFQTIWRTAGGPKFGKRPDARKVVRAVDAAWQQAEKLKAWRDAAETPLTPKMKKEGLKWNFDNLHGVLKNLQRKVARLDASSEPSAEAIVREVRAAWKEAAKLSDWEMPSFDGREIVLGERAGDYYIVRHGLEEGQEVVVQGAFKIDSELQIKAKPSMMSMTTLEITDEFRRELAKVYEPYLRLHEALGNDKKGSLLDDARRNWVALRSSVNGLPPGLLTEEAEAKWLKNHKRLKELLDVDLSQADIDKVREQFGPVATEMVKIAETFGHTQDATLYEAFCPMAFQGKGANWLQAGRQIANPYFGYKGMVDCSSIKRSFIPETSSTKEVPQ